MSEPRFTAKVWYHEGLKKWVATPAEGPGADDFYGTGDSEEAALDALAEGMEAEGYIPAEGDG